MNGRAWGTLYTLGLGACVGTLSPIGRVATYLSARDAERRLEEMFAAYQIPVKEHTPDGRVNSGRFDPNGLWGSSVESRVQCGPGDHERSVRVDYLEVIGTIRQSASGSARVEVESYGAGRGAGGKEYPCRLNQATVDAILKGLPERGRPRSPIEGARAGYQAPGECSPRRLDRREPGGRHRGFTASWRLSRGA